MRAVLGVLAFCLCGFLGAVPALAVPTDSRPGAVLRALDKVTARVQEIGIPIETPTAFGTIVITVKACKTSLPEETPESAVFLDIAELKPGEEGKGVFRGWMFASSPALSALEHPVYDIWLVRCMDAPEGPSVTD